MKHSFICGVLIITAAAAGITLRLPFLHLRAMHTDEAVHAVKFGKLLEENSYVYDKFEYHGPTLNYFTLIPAAIRSEKTFKQISEFTLRVVPVFFGLCLVFMPLLLRKGIGKNAAAVAILLTAVSPVMTFYSCYYIQEMLLVCFSLSLICSVYRYTQSRKFGWLILGGVSLGLMHATKETFIIAAAAMGASAALIMVISPKDKLRQMAGLVSIKAVVLFAVSTIVVSVLFFSSFFTNPHGVIDSVLTYSTYFNRASDNGIHVHPWYDYLQLLLYFKVFGGPVFTEAFVVLAAVGGIVLSFTRRAEDAGNKNLMRFFAYYTILMLAVYSAIPYKTPWCLLGFYSGMIILAGFTISFFMSAVSVKSVRVIALIVLAVGVMHLGYLSYLSNTRYAASPGNPWVYAHTSNDIFKVTEQIKDTLTGAKGSKQAAFDTPIQVVCPGNDYWPFPWYLRDFNFVGYWNGIEQKLPATDVIIASAPATDGSIDLLEGQLIGHLFNSRPAGQKELYLPLFEGYLELRPMVEVRGYITKGLWDKAQQNEK